MDSQQKARHHKRVRQQHARELAQDYVEAIYHLRQKEQIESIRISDLQEIFGVSHVTVIRTLQRLEEQQLITSCKSCQINLTADGENIAREAEARHELIRSFFMKIGVSAEQADADAEGVEHHLSAETLDAVKCFLENS